MVNESTKARIKGKLYCWYCIHYTEHNGFGHCAVSGDIVSHMDICSCYQMINFGEEK